MRWMLRRDVPAVLRIEAESFTHPWSEAQLVRPLRHHGAIGKVAVDRQSDRVLGFVVYLLMGDRYKVLNLAVAPDARRQGVGRRIVDDLAGKLSGHRRRHVEALVCERNVPAQLFFRACRFRAVRTVRRPYDRTDDDGYLFRFSLPRPAAAPSEPCQEAK